IVVQHALTPKMPVEGAQAGRLAVDRGRGGRVPAAAGAGERREEVRYVRAGGLESSHVALQQEPPVLEQVRAVGLGSAAGQAALERETAAEIEHALLERLKLRAAFERGHG